MNKKIRSPRGLWRLVAAAPLPFLLLLYGIWTDLLVLEAEGFGVAGEAFDLGEWVVMAAGTAALVGALWASQRPLRILGYAFYSLALAFGFGGAGVVAIVHAFGGPTEAMTAPAWALVVLITTSVVCVVALLALGALLVDDIRAADAGEP